MSQERTLLASKRSPWLSVRSEKMQQLNFHPNNLYGNQKPIFADRAPETTTTTAKTTTTPAPGDMLGYVFIPEQIATEL